MTTPDLAPLEHVKNLASDTLTDDELSRLATWARLEEPQRRKESASAHDAAATATQNVVMQLWAAQPSLKPAFSLTADGDDGQLVPEWVEPTSDFTAYPTGAHVMSGDRVWMNQLQGLNLTHPGEGAGWWDVTPVIPDGSRTAPWTWEEAAEYQGGQFVLWEGQLFIVTQSHAAAITPDQAPDFYQKIT